MDLSDEAEVRKIVEGCANGDRNCQQMLYKHLYSRMMNVCYRYASRPDDAKDLFQDGFMKVFEKIGKFNFRGSLEGWVRRIMVNNAIDYYRRQKNKFAFSETSVAEEHIKVEDPPGSENIFNELTAAELMAMVQELSPVYRAVFNLYVLDDYSHAEIAEALDISEGTSKSNLYKAKKNLKKIVLEKIKNEK